MNWNFCDCNEHKELKKVIKEIKNLDKNTDYKFILRGLKNSKKVLEKTIIEHKKEGIHFLRSQARYITQPYLSAYMKESSMSFKGSRDQCNSCVLIELIQEKVKDLNHIINTDKRREQCQEYVVWAQAEIEQLKTFKKDIRSSSCRLIEQSSKIFLMADLNPICMTPP